MKMLNKIKVPNLLILGLFVVLIIVFSAVLLIFSGGERLFHNIAVALVLSWVIVLIAYYLWAIYFYNVNFGWEDKDWDDVDKKKAQDEPTDEPEGNPFSEHTLGLPPGTVRGTIAISLLVAGLAMVIASLDMNSTLREDEFFIDNFEFFKTAFLMMIAFYFGNKALEYLKERKTIFGVKSGNAPGSSKSQTANVSAGNKKDLLQNQGLADSGPDSYSSNSFDDPNSQG